MAEINVQSFLGLLWVQAARGWIALCLRNRGGQSFRNAKRRYVSAYTEEKKEELPDASAAVLYVKKSQGIGTAYGVRTAVLFRD